MTGFSARRGAQEHRRSHPGHGLRPGYGQRRHGVFQQRAGRPHGGNAPHPQAGCGDHYVYFDRQITPIHYLRFSERAWRKWHNDLQYQNRLRPVDFVESARQAGLDVILDTHKPRPDLLAKLPSMPIDEAFRRYPAEQLCCTSIDFAARRLPDAAVGTADEVTQAHVHKVAAKRVA